MSDQTDISGPVLPIDEAIYSKAQTASGQLEQAYTKRDEMCVKYEQMYLLTSTIPSNDEDIKVTLSTDARNVIKGIVRLLATTVPTFKCTVGPDDDPDIADAIEAMAATIWEESSKAYGGPIHETVIESSGLYGETHIAINSTADIVKNSAKSNKKHAQRIATRTPFLLEPWNPHYGYPLTDPIYGLTAYVRKVKMTVGEIGSRFGAAGQTFAQGKDPTQTEDLYMYYDTTDYAIWVKGTPFVAEAHNLTSIPIGVTLTDGTLLFSEPEEQRQPILYGIAKSALHERKNLMMTVLFTNIYHLGLNPTFVHTAPANNPTKTLSYDASKSGGVVDMEYGERLDAMTNKGIMDPSFVQAMNLLDAQITESTVQKTALGAALEGSPAYSTYALLAQSGRLPLVQIQTRTEFAIADVMEKAIEWYAEKGPATDGMPKPAEIPDTFSLSVKLDVNLPQDKLQLANIATMLKSAGIVDDTWIRSNILNVENSVKMQEDIWSQQMAQTLFDIKKQTLMNQAQMEAQAQQQQQGGQLPGARPNDQPIGNLGTPTPANKVGGQGMNPAAGGLAPNAAGTLPAQVPEGQGG